MQWLSKNKLFYSLCAFLLPFIFYIGIFFGQSFGLECATGIMGFKPPYQQTITSNNTYCLNISDIGAYAWQHVPQWTKVSTEYLNFRFPLWNQNNGIGVPLAANFISAAYFIPNIFFATFNNVFAFDFYFVLRMAIASLGMYLFLRTFKLPKLLSLIGSLMIFLNGYVTYLPTIVHHNVDILLPWIALLIYKSFETKKAKYFIILSLVASLSHFGAMPESSVFIALFYIFYALFLTIIAEKNNKRKLLSYFICSFFLSLFLASILMIPGYEYIINSVTLHKFSLSQSYSFNWQNILFFVFPRIFGTLGETDRLADQFKFSIHVLDYIGVVASFILIIAVLLFVFKRDYLKKQRHFKHYLFFFFFLTALLTQYFGIIHNPLFEKVPGFAQTTFTKYSLSLINFLVASIVVFTIYYCSLLADKFINLYQYLRKYWVIFLAIIVFLTIELIVFSFFKNFAVSQNIFPHFIKILLFSTAIVFTTALVMIVPFKTDKKYLLLFLIVAVEFYMLLPHNGDLKRRDSLRKPPAINYLRTYDYKSSRIFSPDYILYPNLSTLFDLNDIRNLDALWVKSYYDYLKYFIVPEMDKTVMRFTGLRENTTIKSAQFTNNVFFDLLSVKYLLTYRDLNTYEDSGVIRSYVNQIGEFPSLRQDIFTINHETKPVLFEHPPTKIVLNVERPLGANYFYLYPALSPDVFSKSDGVKFVVTFLDKDTVLFQNSITIDPRKNKQNNWEELSFGPFPENLKKFKLILETDPMQTTAWDWAGWGGFEWDTEKNIKKTYQFKKVYDREMKIYENTHFVPRLHPISEIKCSKNEEDTISQMKENESKMRNLGIVLASNCKPRTFNTKDISLTNQKFNDQKVSFLYSSPHESYIILSNTFYPGWKLKIEGREDQIDQVNLAFQGLRLPKGNNLRVEIIYDPLSFKLGLFLTLISLGLCGFILTSKYQNKNI